MIKIENFPEQLYTVHHTYEKGAEIFSSGSASGGLIRSGMAALISVDENGVRRIHSYYLSGDIFLFSSFPAFTEDAPALIARTRCSVDLFFLEQPKGGSDPEPVTVDFRSLLTSAQRHQLAHIHVLEQQTIRKKLLAFLELASEGRSTFLIPMTLTDCADYLAVDRSAMMRELSRMENEGLIRHKGRRFTFTD